MAKPNHIIQRQSVPDMVAISLRARILSGEFKDGDQIRQEAIAAEYDVSRMPIREALRQLEAEGLVRLQTHKGAVVTTLSPDDIGELFDLRALLEPDIFQRAIRRMTPDDISKSETLLKRLEGAYRSKNTQDWGLLNWDYHKSLYLAAGRAQTLALLQTINHQTNRYVRLQLVLTSAVKIAEKDHRELLRLAREKDEKRAGAYLAKHILDAKDALLAAMKPRKTLAAE